MALEKTRYLVLAGRIKKQLLKRPQFYKYLNMLNFITVSSPSDFSGTVHASQVKHVRKALFTLQSFVEQVMPTIEERYNYITCACSHDTPSVGGARPQLVLYHQQWM